MTFAEKLKKESPEKLANAIVVGHYCPAWFGYTDDVGCPIVNGTVIANCINCWNREAPESEKQEVAEDD